MDALQGNWRHAEAALHIGIGDVAIVTEQWTAPIDILKRTMAHHLQLSFLPTAPNAKGRFPDVWGPSRFERMGSLFLLPAGQSVHARSNCRIQRSITCRIDPAALSTWFDRDLEWTDRRLMGTLDISSATIRRLLGRIADELRNPGFARAAMIELIVAEIGIELSRHFLGIEDKVIAGGLSPWRLRQIDECLADATGPVTLAALAALCNLSVRHLTRSFRASRGRSLGTYIAERRIDQARRLLAAGRSVKEAAFAAGFGAPTNFATAFRRATGESPRQYRDPRGGEDDALIDVRRSRARRGAGPGWPCPSARKIGIS